MAGFTELVPAGLVFAAIFGDHLRGRLQWEVRRAVGEIKEERFPLLLRVVDELERPVREHEGRVPFARTELRGFRRCLLPVEVDELRARLMFFVREVELAEARGGRTLEAFVPGRRAGLLAEVPFADHRSVVAGGAEDLGDRDRAVVEAAVGAERFRKAHAVEVAHAGLVGVESGQQGGPGRAATGRVVELSEADAVLGERVDIRRRDLAAVATKVGPSHVIDHDEQDVRLGGRQG